MSEDDEPAESAFDTFNDAGDHSIVGIQGGNVHNSHVYITHQGDSPQKTYAVGVCYLNGGVPTKARALIDEAIARGYNGPEVYFHRVLATFSKRSWIDLGHEAQEWVLSLSNLLPEWRSGQWCCGLAAVVEMARSLKKSGVVSEAALDMLDAVPATQRALIVQHLDLVLTGAAKDRSWAMTSQIAQERQQSCGRRGRVWAYFYPDPAGVRSREIVHPVLFPSGRLHVFIWFTVLTMGVSVVVWTVLAGPSPRYAVALVPAIAAAAIALLAGQDLHYRRVQLALKESVHARRPAPAPERGFARDVDDSFERYLSRYLPNEWERRRFDMETRGLKAALRDEIVEDYRESRTEVRKVNWLIRHELWKLIDEWRRGTLFDYRERYRPPGRTVGMCVLAVLCLVISGWVLVAPAIATAPLLAASSILAVLVGGGKAVPRRFGIVTERRCREVADRERKAVIDGRQRALEKWRRYLISTRPSEVQMETWLDCDKKILLNKALRDYRLPWSDVVAHAFLLLPTRGCQRAKEDGGPWRYDKYDLRLFLLTRHGVRELLARLTFVSALLRTQERHTFRFDALSCVRVEVKNGGSYVLEITLTNGPPRSIQVASTTPLLIDNSTDDSPEEGSESRHDAVAVDLDAAGFEHTRRVLEGIAADGKQWIS